MGSEGGESSVAHMAHIAGGLIGATMALHHRYRRVPKLTGL